MGRQGGGLGRGGGRVLIGEAGLSRLLEMRRDERAAVAAVHRGPRHPLVQAAPQRQVRVRVKGVADQRVPEVERHRVGAGQDEIGVLQLAQGTGHLIRAGLGDGGQQVEIEGTPDDGGGRRHVAGPRGQELGAGQHRVAQRVRHRGRLYRGAGLRRQRVRRRWPRGTPRRAAGCRRCARGSPPPPGPAPPGRASRWSWSRSAPGPGAAAGSPRRAAGRAGGPAGCAWAAGGRARRCGTRQRPASAWPRAPARWPSTSRLSSSAQCRSSRISSTGVREFGRHDQVGQVLDQQAAPVVRVTGAGGDLAHPRRQALAEVAQRPARPRRSGRWPGPAAGPRASARHPGRPPRGQR